MNDYMPNPEIVAHTNLYGPQSNLKMILDVAEERKIRTQLIPYDLDNPLASFVRSNVLLVTHTDTGDQSDINEMIQRANEHGTHICEVEDLPRKAFFGPYWNEGAAGKVDTVITAQEGYEDELKKKGYNEANIIHLGIPAHLQAGMESMRLGKKSRLDSDDDRFHIHALGMKDLIKDRAIIQQALMAAEQIKNAVVTYFPHRGTDDYYRKKKLDKPEGIESWIAEHTTHCDDLELPDSARKELDKDTTNPRAFHCGYAAQNGVSLLYPDKTATESISAAHLGVPTITVETGTHESKEWYVNTNGGTVLSPLEDVHESVMDLVQCSTRGNLEMQQRAAFNRIRGGSLCTAHQIVDLLVKKIQF